MQYNTISIVVRPNSTIEALIRHYNDLTMDPAHIKYLVDEFNMLNPDARPPRPGQTVVMPVLVYYR